MMHEAFKLDNEDAYGSNVHGISLSSRERSQRLVNESCARAVGFEREQVRGRKEADGEGALS